jgi:hypothetical protein
MIRQRFVATVDSLHTNIVEHFPLSAVQLLYTYAAFRALTVLAVGCRYTDRFCSISLRLLATVGIAPGTFEYYTSTLTITPPDIPVGVQ